MSKQVDTKSAEQKWIEAKEKVKAAQAELLQAEIDLYNFHSKALSEKDEGTISIKNNGFKVKVIKKMDVKVDQERAKLYPDLFKVKYESSKTLEKFFTDEQKENWVKCVTTKPAKPSFEVVKEEE